MALDRVYAVVLAGGRGERFWPLSTASRPKQLLALVGERPMIAQTVARLDGLVPRERVLVVTNAETAAVTRELLPELPPENVFGEPVGRDTAAAVALSAALVRARDPDAAFAILPADHVIAEPDRFRGTLDAAFRVAQREDVLVVIGIPPTAPLPSFGYIEADAPRLEMGGRPFHAVRRFVEKPDVATARRYLAEGRFFWNAGMFVWSLAALDRALARHAPRYAELARRLADAARRPGFDDAARAAYADIEKISIDYALMEKADNILMVPADFRWDDVGSWTALRNHFPADAQSNVAIGDCAALDAEGNTVYSPGRLTALLGVRDLVVVQAEGVTLICHRDRAEHVKRLVQQLQAAGGHEALL